MFSFIKKTNTIDPTFEWTIQTFNNKVLDRNWFSARTYLSRNWQSRGCPITGI